MLYIRATRTGSDEVFCQFSDDNRIRGNLSLPIEIWEDLQYAIGFYPEPYQIEEHDFDKW